MQLLGGTHLALRLCSLLLWYAVTSRCGASSASPSSSVLPRETCAEQSDRWLPLLATCLLRPYLCEPIDGVSGGIPMVRKKTDNIRLDISLFASAVCGDIWLLRHLRLPRQLRTPEGDLLGAVRRLAFATPHRMARTQYTQ